MKVFQAAQRNLRTRRQKRSYGVMETVAAAKAISADSAVVTRLSECDDIFYIERRTKNWTEGFSRSTTCFTLPDGYVKHIQRI